MAQGFVDSNGIRMHYEAAGQGDLVVLLHGFPEFSYSWRHQLSALAGAGFCAVAPDLRGWGQTDKPRGVDAYRMRHLLADVAGLIAALGYGRAHIVGHDWGGALAWLFAHRYPALTASVSSLNAPHPAAYRRVLAHSWRQRLMSWYILYFQIPWLPEFTLRLGNCAAIRRALRRTVHPEAFSAADLAAYVDNARQPYALTAGVNYYRAMARSRALRSGLGLEPLRRPALIVWGEQDPYLLRENAVATREWAPDLHLHYIADAGHWVQCERPDLVNRYLIEFLRDRTAEEAPAPIEK